MRRLTEWLKRIIPQNLWPLFIVWFVQNAAVYYVARLIIQGRPMHDMSLPLDHQIPFIPFFIVIYLAAYFTWIAGYVIISRGDPPRSEVILGTLIAKLLCFAVFILYPTTMTRPDFTGGGVFGWVTRVVYFFDQSNNLFPSIHCLENYIVWRGMLGRRDIALWIKWAFFLCMLLVFASTLFVRQHLLLDIPSAIIVGEIGLWLSRRLRLEERFTAWLKARRRAA